MRLLLRRDLVAAVVLVMTFGHAAADGAHVSALGDMKWKARPIVVLSDSPDDPRVAKQLAAFDHARPALDERAMKVLHEACPGSALRRHLGIAAHGFAVVLVGKDGDVKKVWRDVVDPRRIFGLVDQMPMRRDEMRG